LRAVALFAVHLLQANHYQPMYGVAVRLALYHEVPCLVHPVEVVASAYLPSAYPEAYLSSWVRHPSAYRHPS
jgi:hypothetical protein